MIHLSATLAKKQATYYRACTLDSRVLFHLVDYFKGLTKAQYRIFEYLLRRAYTSRTLSVSQSYIAQVLDLSRETVNRTLSMFEHHGLVVRESRGIKQINRMYLSAWFATGRAREKLRRLFPFVVTSILGIVNLLSINNVTQEYKSNKEVRKRESNFTCKSLYKSDIACTSNKRARVENQGRVGMKPEVPVEIHKLTFLTERGKIKASAFPVEVVLFIADNVRKKQGIGDVDAYFMKACSMECASRGIQPDWRLMQALCSSFMGDGTEPIIKPEFFETKKAKVGKGVAVSSRVWQPAPRRPELLEHVRNNRDRVEQDPRYQAFMRLMGASHQPKLEAMWEHFERESRES